MAQRMMLFVGAYTGTDPVIPPTPDPVPPAPGDTAPTYPSHMPAPGSIVQDTTVGDEGTAVDTLTWVPTYALPHYVEMRGQIQEFEQGEPTAYSVTRAVRKGFDVTERAMTTSAKDTLLAFFDTHQDEPFFWTPPGGSQGAYALDTGEMVVTKIGGDLWEVRATLREVR